MPFKTPNVTSEYIRGLLRGESDPDLRRITAYAEDNVVPVLLPETAAVLRQLVALKQPEKILEIGTAIGYSGTLMLKNCSGRLYTVEVDEAAAKKAAEFFEAAGLRERVTQFMGNACEIVPLLKGSFDFIFLDGPKTRYAGFYPYLKRLLNPSGVLLADNVLFNGMVDGSGVFVRKKATIAVALDKYLRAVMDDEDMMSSVLPVGDGLSLSIKK